MSSLADLVFVEICRALQRSLSDHTPLSDHSPAGSLTVPLNPRNDICNLKLNLPSGLAGRQNQPIS